MATKKKKKVAQRSWFSELSLFSAKFTVALVILLAISLWLLWPVNDLHYSGYEESHSTPEFAKQHYTVYINDLPFGVESSYKNAPRDAMNFWERATEDNEYWKITFQEVYSPQDADIVINWVKEFGTETIGHTIYLDFIEIGLGDSNCLGKWKPYNYNSVVIIAEHELGHAIGLEHTDNPNTIMYPTIRTSYEIETEETDILATGVAKFYPFCTSDISKYAIDVSASSEVFVSTTTIDSYYKILAGDETAIYYPTCYEQFTTSFQKECTQSLGDGLIIIATEPTQISVTIRDITPWTLTN